MAAVVVEERHVELLRLVLAAELLDLRRQTEDRVARLAHDLLVVHPGKALREVARDGMRAHRPVLGLLLVVLVALREKEVGVGHVLHGLHGRQLFGIVRKRRLVVLDRALVVALGELLRRVLELHLDDVRDLLRRRHGLELRAVVLAQEFGDLVLELAGGRGPVGLRIAEVDVHGVLERAVGGTLAALVLGADEEGLYLLVVALARALLELHLGLGPVLVGHHVAALRDGRLPEKPEASVGVRLLDAGVYLLQLVAVVVHHGLRLLKTSGKELEVRLHRDRAAEVERQVLAPEELVDVLLRGGKVAAARGCALLGRKDQVDVRRLACDVAPDVVVLVAHLRIEHREQRVEGPRGLLLASGGHEDLSVLVAGLARKVHESLRRLRVLGEELVVDLGALVALAAREEVVGELEPGRPVLRARPVRKRGDLLVRLVELAEGEEPADLEREEHRIGLRPLLLRVLDDGLREVGEPRVDERLHVFDLGLERRVRLFDSAVAFRGGILRTDAERPEKGERQHRASENGKSLRTHGEKIILQLSS